MATAEPPITPGVGARRRHTPRLPASAFSPRSPSSGFPTTPDPSLMTPVSIVDAGVSGITTWESLNAWWAKAAQTPDKTSGIVVHAPTLADAESLVELYPGHLLNRAYQAEMEKVLSVAVPLDLTSLESFSLPARLSPSEVRLTITTPFKFPTSSGFSKNLQAAVSAGYVIEVDVQADLSREESWEALEDAIGKAVPSEADKQKPILLKNLLPPSTGYDTPLVKLLTHPVYRSFQGHISTLSLFPNVYVEFAPPTWAAVPPFIASKMENVTSPIEEASNAEKERREWKRRIKLFLGPVVEAFGFSRIIYSSAGSAAAPATPPSDWYTLARECVAEMGVEQDAIDAVFANNALEAYRS